MNTALNMWRDAVKQLFIYKQQPEGRMGRGLCSTMLSVELRLRTMLSVELSLRTMLSVELRLRTMLPVELRLRTMLSVELRLRTMLFHSGF